MPSLIVVDDDALLPTAAEYQERRERARVQARSRYRDHLTGVLSGCGVDDAAAVADVVLDALTEWRYIDSGERCVCSCHPRLPDSDRHDYGFDCGCTRTRDQRRESFQQVLNAIRELWQSPDGEQTRAANEAAEAELHDWLTQHPGVVVHSHGGGRPNNGAVRSTGTASTSVNATTNGTLRSTYAPPANSWTGSTAALTMAPPVIGNESSSKATSSRPAPPTPTATEAPSCSAHSSS